MMIKNLKKTYVIMIAFACFYFPSIITHSMDFDLTGKIETKRKDNLATIIFYNKPDKDTYLIIENNAVIGKLKILSWESVLINNAIEYKAVAAFAIDSRNPDIMKAGTAIGLVREEMPPQREYGEIILEKKLPYKNKIISRIDNREMLLIPEGKFVFGSDSGDRDESPQQVVYLDDYYIDKYEVSNYEYSYYIKEISGNPPVSWPEGKYPDNEKNFPVLVSFYEASGYAKWAGKRLPTEKEWEKAARGIGLEMVKKHDESYILIEKPNIFPWGDKFEHDRANCAEFWENPESGGKIKKNYAKGLLPVDFFSDSGISFFGIVNMSGNACEWTSSWYEAYKDSKYTDKRYGTQVKVIRGGAWFDNKHKLRASARYFGGLPSLFTDNIAGFRCVKDVTISDLTGNN